MSGRRAVAVRSIGAEFAGHRIEAVIGEGGMGIVYRARNLALDRVRALKVLTPSLSADARFRERFRRESRLAASIEHPNVIPVHQAGEEDGQLYLSMRLVEGRDLRELVALEGPLEPGAAAPVIGAVAAGLDAAHAAGADPPRRQARQRAGRRRRRRRARLPHRLRDQPHDARRRDRDRHRRARRHRRLRRSRADRRRGRSTTAPTSTRSARCSTSRSPAQSPFPRETELATLFAHANAPRPRPSAVRAELPPRLDPVVAKAMAIEPGRALRLRRRARPRARGGARGRGDGAALPRLRAGRRRDHAGGRRRGARRAAGRGSRAAAVVAALAVARDRRRRRRWRAAEEPAQPDRRRADRRRARARPASRSGPSASGSPRAVATRWTRSTRSPTQVAFEIPLPAPASVAVGFGSVWAVSKADRRALPPRPARGRRAGRDPARRRRRPVPTWRSTSAGSGSRTPARRTWSRIDPRPTPPPAASLGTEPRSIATGDGARLGDQHPRRLRSRASTRRSRSGSGARSRSASCPTTSPSARAPSG